MLRNFQKLGTVTIASGAAVSGAIEVPMGYALAAIQIPDVWDAADITFQVCTDGASTFRALSGPTGTSTSFTRITGVAVSTICLVPIVLHELGMGMKVKLVSTNVASNANVNALQDDVLTVWVGRCN